MNQTSSTNRARGTKQITEVDKTRIKVYGIILEKQLGHYKTIDFFLQPKIMCLNVCVRASVSFFLGSAS